MTSESDFSTVGDSGSLIVTNDSSHNPVALLFAGNLSGFTIGNPINELHSARLGLRSDATFILWVPQ